MNLETHLVGDVHVLTLHKNLAGGHETQELISATDQILAQGTPRIVIDLGKVDFLSAKPHLVVIHAAYVVGLLQVLKAQVHGRA